MPTTMDAMKLSPTERDILLHRLSVPDAIIDALADGDDGYHSDDVGEAIDRAEAAVRSAELPEPSDAVGRAVLADCIEGSTYLAGTAWAVSDREASPSTLWRHRAAYNALADRVEAVVGRPVRRATG